MSNSYKYIGKSNILDALSFALLLKAISKKHRHMSELIFREENENYKDNKREMYVQLNLKDTASENTQEIRLKRMINSQGISEYFFNEDPLLTEEYLAKVNEYHLNINNFCAYQGKLEELCFGATEKPHLL